MPKDVLVSAMPPYFSWVLDGLLAISAYPYHHTHLRYLTENRIHTVISISPEEEPPFHTKPDLRVISLRVRQLEAPTLEECRGFVSLMENAKRRHEGVLVHDVRGRGRAAVLIACYLIKLWECPADYVLNHLRLIRPASVETDEQESVIKKFHLTVEREFEGYYAKIQQPSCWDNKTAHLGQHYDSLLTTLPAYAIAGQHATETNQEQPQITREY